MRVFESKNEERSAIKGEEKSEPDYAVSPSDLLSSCLRRRELSEEWLAENLKIDLETTRSLLRGETPISPEVAFELERVLGVPSYFWENVEKTFRVRSAKRREEIKR